MESPQRRTPEGEARRSRDGGRGYDEHTDETADTAAFRAFVDRQPPPSSTDSQGRSFRLLTLIGGIALLVVVVIVLLLL